MNIRTRTFRFLLTGLVVSTLAVGGTSQAQLVTAAQGAQVTGYIKQVSGWLTQIQQIIDMKDRLFDSSHWADLISQQKQNLAKYAGLNNVNLDDLQNVYAQFQSVQSRIAGLKNEIGTQSNTLWNNLSAAALDPNDITGTMVGLAPDLAATQDQAASTVAAANEDGKQVVQAQADSATAQKNSMDTADQVAKRSVESLKNSTDLVQSAANAQSTREVTQVVAQGVAQLVADNALNNTAITASLAQSAKQSEILNGSMTELVKDRIEERKSQALAAAAEVDAQTRMAEQQGQNVGTVVQALSSSLDLTQNQPLTLDMSMLQP